MRQPVLSGLGLATDTLFRRRRSLPLGGQVEVAIGSAIEPATLIGYNSAAERLHFLRTEVEADKMAATLLKKVGDGVKRGEPVAYFTYLFGLGYKEYVSPVDGTVEAISTTSGIITIREHPTPVTALLRGMVVEVEAGRSAVIEGRGTVIDAAVGHGEASSGRLVLLPAEARPADIPADARGAVLAVPGFLTAPVLVMAFRAQAAGMVAAGCDHQTLAAFARETAGLTFEEFAARHYSAARRDRIDGTGGSQAVEMTVVLTEGFGRLPMRAEVKEALAAAAARGAWAYVDGRALASGGAARAEVILMNEAAGRKNEPEDGAGAAGGARGDDRVHLAPGARVRLLSGPGARKVGTLRALPAGAVKLETGVDLAAAQVELDGNGEGGSTLVTVPRCNVEVLR